MEYLWCTVTVAWDGSCLGMIRVVSTLWEDERCHCWWMWTQFVMVNPLNLNDTRSQCQVCTDHCSASLLMWPGGKQILLNLEEASPSLWYYFGIPDQTSRHLFLLVTFCMMGTLIKFLSTQNLTAKVQERNLSQATQDFFLWNIKTKPGLVRWLSV